MNDKLISDEELTAIVNGLPGGPTGYCKTWGYRDLADAVIEALLNNPSLFVLHAVRKARQIGFDDGWDERNEC